MKREDFSRAMGNVSTEYIEEAMTFKTKPAFKWRKAVVIAACFCLAVGAGIYALPKLTGDFFTENLDNDNIANHWELNQTSEENKIEVVYTVKDEFSEQVRQVKDVDSTDGEVYESYVNSVNSDDANANVTEQPMTEGYLAHIFSATLKNAPPPEANYTLIPGYRFSFEGSLPNTDKPYYWNAVSWIYGNYFIDAHVGDIMPAGVYVSDDGKSCYIINKKSDGTSIKTTYSILGNDYEDYEVISVDTYLN